MAADPSRSKPREHTTQSRLRSLFEIPRLVLAILMFPVRLWRHGPSRKNTGRTQPVMVIPGFGFGDRSTFILRWYLRRCGFQVTGWKLGRNLGRKTIGLHNQQIIARVEMFSENAGRPVVLVGWSMGGIIARMVARERPELVSRVVCLSAPFTGDVYDNRAWPVYERMSGHSLDDPVARRQINQSRKPLPVPSSAIFSRSDGVVSWRCCVEPEVDIARNIEVDAGHFEIGFRPKVLRLVAREISQPQD